jgi:hypothetical protein
MAKKPFALGLAILLVCTASQSAWAVVTGQYLLEGTAADTSGFGRNGTLNGAPTFGTGLYVGSTASLELDGTSQSMLLPAPSDFVRNAPGATLVAWVRPDSITGTRTILALNNGDTLSGGGLGSGRAVLQIASNQFRALGRIADGGSSVTLLGGSPVIGTTYMVAGVFDYAGGGLRLYVNGNQVGTSSPAWAANVPDTANLAAHLGANAIGTGEFWDGAIDGARIYNTALSATDILNLYVAESPAPPVPGDTNGNGLVEANDLTPIRDNWRMTGRTRQQGNLSGDTAGLVDFADFREWKTAILAGGGSLEGIDLSFTAVPEPAAALLVLIGSFGLCGCRGTRCRRTGHSR